MRMSRTPGKVVTARPMSAYVSAECEVRERCGDAVDCSATRELVGVAYGVSGIYRWPRRSSFLTPDAFVSRHSGPVDCKESERTRPCGSLLSNAPQRRVRGLHADERRGAPRLPLMALSKLPLPAVQPQGPTSCCLPWHGGVIPPPAARTAPRRGSGRGSQERRPMPPYGNPG